MNPLFEHLKAVIEGVPNLPNWRGWFAEHEIAIAELMPRGEMLRLRYHPNKEIPKILQQHSISFVHSTSYEWLDADSTSGRCRDCGAQLQHAKAGDTWTRCPNGCFVMEAHHALSHAPSDA
jgi:hypothetical protein